MGAGATILHQLLAVVALAGLVAVWLAVQRAWRRSFAGDLPEPSEDDALAARGGCDGCSCGGGVCRRKDEGGSGRVLP